MTAQIQTSRAYTRSLLQSQEEMKEIYKSAMVSWKSCGSSSLPMNAKKRCT